MTQLQQLQPVKVTEIVMTAGTQMRSWMNTEAVAEYAALMKEGVEFDPIEVYLVDDKVVLVNGFHRVNAAIKAQLESISALITVGTMEEALWAAIAANKKNALKRNSSDIQRAIEAALLHPQGATLSDRQVADHVGCSHPTVGSVRAKLLATGKLSSDTVRTGKDGRSINTANIGSKHQMERWQGLVFKPWIASASNADLYLIHKDDQYIDISQATNQPPLKQRYHVDYAYFHPHGSGEGGYAACFDRGYVDLFEEEGLKVYIEEFADLPELMQRVAKGVLADKYGPKTQKLVRVDPLLQPGDKIGKVRHSRNDKSDYVVATVVGVSKSFIHVRLFGQTADEIWYGHELASLEEVYRPTQSHVSLTSYYHWKEKSDTKWIDEFTGLKEFYAPQAFLFVRSATALVTFGDDALNAAAALTGISAVDEQFGPVFITFDEAAIERLAVNYPVVIYDRQGQALIKNFWQNIVAGQARPAAPASAPALEDRAIADELDIDEQLTGLVLPEHGDSGDHVEEAMYTLLDNFGFDEIEDLSPSLEKLLLFVHGLYKPDETVHQSVTVWRDFLNRIEATIFEAEKAS